MPREFSNSMKWSHRTRGVDEAIVKFHSSINLGCERKPPSPVILPGMAREKAAQRTVHDPWVVA